MPQPQEPPPSGSRKDAADHARSAARLNTQIRRLFSRNSSCNLAATKAGCNLHACGGVNSSGAKDESASRVRSRPRPEPAASHG